MELPLITNSIHSGFKFNVLPPLTLYVHVPWCVRKCPYCDFNSHESKNGFDENAYVTALLADLEQELPKIWGRRVESIFIGGGTPSLFSPDAMADLVSGLRARLNLVAQAEITMEANPGTVEQQKLTGFRQAGINRLSLGVQSFNDDRLKSLGRIHNSSEAVTAVERARKAGFDNLNLDLMFGLPAQTIEQASSDIEQAIALAPDHISLYQLTIEPNTLFHHSPPALPPDDTIWSMQEALQAKLAESGFEQYETSAYAKAGHRCRHNLNYWQFGDYLGIGAGAHGKISFADHITRTRKTRHPQRYLELAASEEVSSSETVTADGAMLEFMMNALRLTEGFASELINERSGLPISNILGELEQAETKGLIERDLKWIRPTETGKRYLNDLLQIFVPD